MPYLLAYISRSTVSNTPAILDDISLSSSKNNSLLGVTGILLLNGNYFFQVLEGREDYVKKTYSKIGCDDRHTESKIVLSQSIDEVHFKQWYMRAFNLDDYYDVNMCAFRKGLNETMGNAVNDRDDVLRLIKLFKSLVVETDQYKKN